MNEIEIETLELMEDHKNQLSDLINKIDNYEILIMLEEQYKNCISIIDKIYEQVK